MDLINWSLNAIDTIFSSRSLGAGEPDCPDGTFAAGYTMDAWERWRIVCLTALSVEVIEDIYLFGTMITGLLLIGLGFALGYRRIQKTGTAVQPGSLTRLPVLIEAVGRAVSIETVLTVIWILSWRSSRLCRGKLTVLETRMDKESSRGIGIRLLALRQNNRNLIFLAPSHSGLKVAAGKITPGKGTAVRRSCFLPHSTDIDYKLLHTHTHTSPPPITHLRRFALIRQPDKRV